MLRLDRLSLYKRQQLAVHLLQCRRYSLGARMGIVRLLLPLNV